MTLFKTLESETFSVLNWFSMNEMKSNKRKCHLIVADLDHKSYSSSSYIYLENEFLESEERVELLGMIIDQTLDFEEHINSEERKSETSYQKVFKQREVEIDWVTADLNRKINKLHERAPMAVYQDKHLTFEHLLNRDGSFTIHERNLQILVIEMYKVKHNLCPKPIQELLIPAIRGNHEWVLPKVRRLETPGLWM